MHHARKLPVREQVFLESLQWFGFKLVYGRSHLKFRRGYVIPSTIREDGDGIDLWVKLPLEKVLYPVQLTQRGVRIFRLLGSRSEESLTSFQKRSEERILAKASYCHRDGIAFVLLRDYIGSETNLTIARRDYRALMFGLQKIKRRSV
jgi:hypothetical protein